MVKSKCTYQDVEVEIEFVDLPGRGDNHGNALIGKELDLADIILVFKNGASGRQVTVDDLKEVFERRKVFEYISRPMFVVIENDRENAISQMDEDSARIRHQCETDNLVKAWEKLQEEEILDCYKVVYQRLPLTTSKKFLEKFQEESKALIFATEQNEQFLSFLGEAIVQHVNKVILKKNIHPVVQDINQDANIRKTRIKAINKMKAETKETKANNTKKSRGKFKSLKRGSVPFEVSLDSSEDEDFFNNIKIDISDMKLHAASDMLQVHDDLLDVFKNELTMQQLLNKLESSLQKHCDTLLEISERNNGLSDSVHGLTHFARMSCEKKVNKFMKETARGLIDNCLKKLVDMKPSKAVQDLWTESHDDEDQAFVTKNLLEDHFDTMVQHLASFLEKGSRGDKLIRLLEALPDGIDEMMKLGVANDGFVDVNKMIKESNLKVSKFSLNMMHEINPHLEHEKEFLDSKVETPKPLMTSKEHGAKDLPSINHDSRLNKVLGLLSKKRKGALDELRRMLGLEKGSLTVPDSDCDEFLWTRILLKVLQFDDDFHHMTSKNSELKSYCDELGTIPDSYLKIAKQQLFGFQRSTAKCDIKMDVSISNDTISIKINEAQDGLTAFASPDLRSELKKLESLELTEQLAPVFIPSIHYGPNIEALGNLYLEEDPWSIKERDDEDDDDDDTVVQETNKVDERPTGLEELPATIFCVCEPDHETHFRSTLDKKPPNSNNSFRYVVLPQNGRGIGVSRSIIKLLAEALKLPQYWTIDDDIKLIREYNKNSGYWKRCTIGRALLYGQRVYDDCTKSVMKDIPEDERYEYGQSLPSEIFPAWAKRGITMAKRLMYNEELHDEVKSNIFCLNDQFTDKMMQEDCNGDPEKEIKWCEAVERYVEEFKKILLEDNYKRIGRVSIGHESGRRHGYYSRSDTHYRKSMQNYQMVLHNTEALKCFNYVTDDVVLRQNEGTVNQKNLRDIRYFGSKWEDKSLCKAMEFYGIIGYQVITVAFGNQKLRNVFGRIGNSWVPEQSESGDDETTSDD